MNNILLLNGPNLNLLGQREPDIYGNKDLSQIESELKGIALKHGSNLEAFQSNSESDLVNIIQDKSENTDFIIINPGGYTHTSVAIRDAILAVAIPFIEIHISNIHSREEFRKESYFSDIAVGTISGLGFKGYELAALAAIDFLNLYPSEYENVFQYALEKMYKVDGITIYGNAPERTSTISFNIDNIASLDIAQLLDYEGITVRSGHHCCQPLMKSLNILSCARISFYVYNTNEEVDIFIEKLNETIKKLS